MSPSPRSGRAVLAFAVAVLGPLGGVFPFAGFAALVACALAARAPGGARFLRGSAIVLGSVSTALAAFWIVVRCGADRSVGRASCPGVYSWDGADYHLDTSVVASSLYPWAQHLDVDRAAHLRPAG